MTRPMLLADFKRLPPAHMVEAVVGLSATIDSVAACAAPSRRFLRYGWFAAALAAYGGTARTLIVQREGVPVATLPIVPTGPAWLGLVSVPGCYWPMRSFPVAADAGVDAGVALLDALGRQARVLRIGPVHDDDPALGILRAAAATRGWRAIPRDLGETFVLDLAALRSEEWPRASTRKKNRYAEKQLAADGTLDWSFRSGPDWNEALFDMLATVEAASWVGTRTGGNDAKFMTSGHGAFWRAAATDPVLAEMMRAAVLRVGKQVAAFAFDLDAGDTRYVIANSYDPAFARHSPGKLLAYRDLADAEGIASVDWGSGDSGYKRVVGAVPGAAVRDWLFFRPGAAAWASRWIERRWTNGGD